MKPEDFWAFYIVGCGICVVGLFLMDAPMNRRSLAVIFMWPLLLMVKTLKGFWELVTE